jgi:hypothetical protein
MGPTFVLDTVENVKIFLIVIYIQQDATLHSLFYLETALYVSGGNITHHQERKQMYLQRLVFVTPFIAICRYRGGVRTDLSGGVRQLQHIKTSSNSLTIAVGSNNGVTNTRRCRYSCLRS